MLIDEDDNKVVKMKLPRSAVIELLGTAAFKLDSRVITTVLNAVRNDADVVEMLLQGLFILAAQNRVMERRLLEAFVLLPSPAMLPVVEHCERRGSRSIDLDSLEIVKKMMTQCPDRYNPRTRLLSLIDNLCGKGEE